MPRRVKIEATAEAEQATGAGTTRTRSLISNQFVAANDISDWISDWEERRNEYKKAARKAELMAAFRASVLCDPLRLGAELSKMHRREEWLRSLQRLDPRFQILMYFDEVARQGGPLEDPLVAEPRISLLRGFPRAAAFTVWRPTSREAISKMMKGEATGKGLDVKGKSAKCGKLAGLIPFLQIHNNEDKKNARWPPRDGRISIFYKNQVSRDVAEKALYAISLAMRKKVSNAKLVLSTLSDIANNEEEHISFMEKKQWWDVEDSEVYRLDESGDIGLDVAERVFFETYINRQDISIEGTEYENGRPSRAAFQDMNFECTRKYSGSGPRVVVLQTCEKEALRPQSIVVAYKENGFVTPVVSDFDCFTLGTRGVAFESPLPKDQVELLKWLIQKIVTILDSPQTDKSWTSCWLDVLKDSASKGFTPKIPAYGFGDSKSYAIMEGAVSRFQHNKNGAIRHGSESFNYYFPQELDDQFLVISDCLPGNIPWKYVDAEELKKLLCEKIDEGFCFPLNPKWILADQGWKKVYDQMMGSTCENTQTSLNSWYPKDSGIQELIESVHERFPNGFQRLVATGDDNGEW